MDFDYCIDCPFIQAIQQTLEESQQMNAACPILYSSV